MYLSTGKSYDFSPALTLVKKLDNITRCLSIIILTYHFKGIDNYNKYYVKITESYLSTLSTYRILTTQAYKASYIGKFHSQSACEQYICNCHLSHANSAIWCNDLSYRHYWYSKTRLPVLTIGKTSARCVKGRTTWERGNAELQISFAYKAFEDLMLLCKRIKGKKIKDVP